jgi:hypothetical protein
MGDACPCFGTLRRIGCVTRLAETMHDATLPEIEIRGYAAPREHPACSRLSTRTAVAVVRCRGEPGALPRGVATPRRSDSAGRPSYRNIPGPCGPAGGHAGTAPTTDETARFAIVTSPILGRVPPGRRCARERRGGGRCLTPLGLPGGLADGVGLDELELGAVADPEEADAVAKPGRGNDRRPHR